MRKLLLAILALAAIAVAIVSYEKFYARKDVSRMLGEARLTASTKTALSLNRHLDNANIEVSVVDGVVTLTGAVGTEIQKELAGEIVRSIKGVKSIQNNLVISRGLMITQQSIEPTLGERLDDLTIEASVKTALMLNTNVSARNIGVDSDRGHVLLTGKVASPAEAELARKIADDVEGVASVEFKLALEDETATETEGGKKSFVEKVDDVRVSAQVNAALMVNRNLDASEIEVASEGGVVRLSGIVHSGAEKDLAQKVAEDCWGVKSVDNQLRVKPIKGTDGG
jgi:osmotically-inducible protein OsmY